MFNNDRYLTRGVQAVIPPVLQFFMWKCIDDMKLEKDYFQIFTLSEENGIQKIIHKQEIPEYEQVYYIIMPEPVNAKVYIIDDESHSTMLLAEEY